MSAVMDSDRLSSPLILRPSADAVRLPYDLPEIAQTVNSGLNLETAGEVFVTAILGRLDPKSRIFTCINAGHPSAVVLNSAGTERACFASGGLPLAILPDLAFAAGESGTLADGDLLFLYTDGLTEAQPDKKPQFGIQRALQVVRRHQRQPAAEIIEAVYQAVCEYLGTDKPKDDITVVVVKVLGGAKESATVQDLADACEANLSAPADSSSQSHPVESEFFAVERTAEITVVRLFDTRHFDTDQVRSSPRRTVCLRGTSAAPSLARGFAEHRVLLDRFDQRAVDGPKASSGWIWKDEAVRPARSAAGSDAASQTDRHRIVGVRRRDGRQAGVFGNSNGRQTMIGTECFRVEQSGDITIVRIVDTRYFDTDNYAQLQLDLVDFVARQQPPKLLVDLGSIQYCSTALTNTLLLAQKRMNAWTGQMKLFGLSEVVLETLHRLRLVGTLFSVYADEAAAKQACA